MAGGYIYLLIDGTNDFEYVGQTRRSVELRFKEHLHEKTYIGNAMRAHGADMFVVAILKQCDTNEELDRWEKHFILSRGTKSPNGYNCTDGGNACTGLAPESHAKMSALRRHYSPYKNLLVEMDRRQLSYTALAKLAGLSLGKVSDKMLGKIKFTAKDAVKLEKFFGLPAEYLLARDDGLPAITSKSDLAARSSATRRHYSPYKNLLAEMDRRQLSYTALAKLAGLSPRKISDKMRDRYKFTAKDAAKLAEFFGKPAEYLLARDDGLPAITSKSERNAKISLARRGKTPYKNLLAEMDKRRLSYTALAKLAGLSPRKISDKMRDRYKFTAKDAAKLVKFFGLPAEYLLARDDGLPAITSKSERNAKISLARREESPYKNLLAEMDKRRLSYSELAKILGVTQPTVFHKMRGRYKFTARDKAKLVEFFGLPAEYLFAT